MNTTGIGDFTKERHEQPEPTNEEIMTGILRLQEEYADVIAAKNAKYMERCKLASS